MKHITKLALLLLSSTLAQSLQAQEVIEASVKIRAEISSKCLQPLADSKAVGAQAVQYACAPKDSQLYDVLVRNDGSYTLINRASKLCLQVPGGVPENGIVLNHGSCDVTLAHQRFTPSFVRAGRFALVSQHSGSCIDVKSSSKSNNGVLTQYKCHLKANQGFYLDVLSGKLSHVVSAPTDEPQLVDKGGPALTKTFKGINLTGLESGNLTDKNVFNRHYAAPKQSLIDYVARKGFTIIRLPFKQKRLQPKLQGPLNRTELSRIDAIVQAARAKGMIVILDPHDYGNMSSDETGSPKRLIGTAAMPGKHLANFWARLSHVYKNQPNVWFNIMNEPHSQNARMWQSIAVQSISAIRSIGAKQKILIPGTSYTGAHSWIGSGNGKVWAGYTDTNFLMEVHQYLDIDAKKIKYSGTSETCIVGAGASKLVAFRDWAVANGKKAFLGEFGFGSNANCLKEGEAQLEYLQTNSKIFSGWTYFGAGYYNGFMTLNPESLGTSKEADKVQMGLVEDYN